MASADSDWEESATGRQPAAVRPHEHMTARSQKTMPRSAAAAAPRWRRAEAAPERPGVEDQRRGGTPSEAEAAVVSSAADSVSLLRALCLARAMW